VFLTVLIYVSVIAFIGLSLYKGYKYASMPLHGRLALYPVPHEPGARAHHGGSYYEEMRWYRKPRKISHIGELLHMAPEMLFIKILFVNQRRHWWFAYAMHLGIYLLGLWFFLLLVGAITELMNWPVTAYDIGWGGFVYYATLVVGVGGIVLFAFGSISLMIKRLASGVLSKYTNARDYFNLLFLIAVVVSGIIVWDVGFYLGREVMKSLLTFQPIEADMALTIHLILLGMVLIYIPFSKMSHYVGKFFAYHKILWGDEPNLRGSNLEKKVQKALSYKPKDSWSAPHIKKK
jgi:nitrate reductase gamma subunit